MNDLIKVFYKTLEYAYLPSQKNMDFATFCTLGNLLKLFIENNNRSNGYLSLGDLLSAGQVIGTYPLIKNYTSLFITNNVVYENLRNGIKIDNFYKLDDKRNKTLNLNSYYLKNSDRKTSVDELFFIYRIFEIFYSYSSDSNFQLNYTIMSKAIKDEFFEEIDLLFTKSYQDFKNVITVSNMTETREMFDEFTFHIMDINNNTFIEIHELLLVYNTAQMFYSLNSQSYIGKRNEQFDVEELGSIVTNNEEKFLNFVIVLFYTLK